jgi:hypothetical protein
MEAVILFLFLQRLYLGMDICMILSDTLRHTMRSTC